MNIPKCIYQTWETKNISDGFKMLISTWKKKNPNYEYFLYDEKMRREFIYEKFGERVGNAYNKIRAGAFKADLWRYCILYEYGGIFVDIDTICMNNIDDFLENEIEFMTPIADTDKSEGENNLLNGFIASIPKHPIFLDCIYRIVSNVENKYNPTNILAFTGPNLFGQCVNKYLGRDEDASFIGMEGTTLNSKFKFLKFRKEDEYIYDIRNSEKVLFQNKNGNRDIQFIYHIECCKLDNFVSWLDGSSKIHLD